MSEPAELGVCPAGMSPGLWPRCPTALSAGLWGGASWKCYPCLPLGWPPLLENTIYQVLGELGVKAPESTLAWFIFAAGNLYETFVERKVVANRILKRKRKLSSLYTTCYV
ncbi:hypothetical protein CEXT_154351 [Caerostris extrusa]|uniref:Uncharacterized protein n=1 Tax=Caerostris extrusa TaxID=172846 RepID=A0AAV4XIZ4_CAEEX|nr:hypothetical protein CEXT_154351 [Caerostris extrusa]